MVSPNNIVDKELKARRIVLPQGVNIFGAPNAVEYPAPTIFVVGPSNEMDQYEDAGQLYFDTDNNALFMYIP